MKFSVAIIVVFLYLSDVTTGQIEIEELPCGATWRCSLVEDPVWATDGVKCYVFINACHLGIENCIRERAGLKPLLVVDKDKCKPLCNAKCEECDKPVCGYRNDVLLDFASLCWMEYFNCMTGQIYYLHHYGQCKQR